MARIRSHPPEIEDVAYRPPTSQSLGVDTLNLQELQARGSPDHLRAVQRMEFLLLLLYTRGSSVHEVDFEAYPAEPGSLIVVRPGQVHRFHLNTGLQGDIIAVAPDFVGPQLGLGQLSGDPVAGLPAQQWLPAALRREFRFTCESLRRDVAPSGPPALRKALARHRLLALLTALQLVSAGSGASRAMSPSPVRARNAALLGDFDRLLEQHLTRHWSVKDYADRLGYAERTLTRATLSLRGCTAKQLIDRRTALEVKRWLAHSNVSVSEISHRLGFSDPSYCVQFFKRVEGYTPDVFRQQQRS